MSTPDYSIPSILTYVLGMLLLLISGFGIAKLFNYFDERHSLKHISAANNHHNDEADQKQQSDHQNQSEATSTAVGNNKPKLYKKVALLQTILKFKEAKPFYKTVETLTGSANYLSIMRPRYSIIAKTQHAERIAKANNTKEKQNPAVDTTETRNNEQHDENKNTVESYQKMSIVIHQSVIQDGDGNENQKTSEDGSFYSIKIVDSKHRVTIQEPDDDDSDSLGSSFRSQRKQGRGTKTNSATHTRRLSDPYAKQLRPNFRENVMKKRNAEIKSQKTKVFKQYEHEIALSRMATASVLSLEKEDRKNTMLTKITE